MKELNRILSLFKREQAVNPNWPKFSKGQTIGMFSGEGFYWPDGYEKLTTVKSVADLNGNNLPEDFLAPLPGSNTRVIGRCSGKYLVTMSDKGDPVVVVDEALVTECGFDPNKFNWQVMGEKNRD